MTLLKGKAIVVALKPEGGLTIVPPPSLSELENSGAASIDLRLGRWFVTLRATRVSLLDISKSHDSPINENKLTKQHYVPFGQTFVLHPGSFVLGGTLEWVSLPPGLGGFVGGKSSWGRRGLIIETAAGIHPGFSGCLTLEMTNLGEVPIAIVPGMPICQVVFHKTSDSDEKNISSFNGKRKPTLGRIQADTILEKLSRQLP
ncbi:MAG: dCTP deaminase [Stellaceae bacterium]